MIEMLEPYMINRLEEERRRREEDRRVPLHITPLEPLPVEDENPPENSGEWSVVIDFEV
jgi:hypothetical protein